MASTKHDHGRAYRAKIVPFRGPPEYSEWYGTESDLRSAMQSATRRIGSRYYCESQVLTCPGCDVKEGPKVIATL